MSSTDDLQNIPARHGTATFVPKGSTIKIVNTSGTQVIDTWAFALPTPPKKKGPQEDAQDEQDKSYQEQDEKEKLNLAEEEDKKQREEEKKKQEEEEKRRRNKKKRTRPVRRRATESREEVWTCLRKRKPRRLPRSNSRPPKQKLSSNLPPPRAVGLHTFLPCAVESKSPMETPKTTARLPNRRRTLPTRQKCWTRVKKRRTRDDGAVICSRVRASPVTCLAREPSLLLLLR
ncbi:unnamed protein product [Aureobasidium pullulans]|nr:unnamed protein product [Aureobasidium pullulans]